MRLMKNISVLILAILASSCGPSDFRQVDEYPEIVPDYVGVTVPEGMAQLNFEMKDGSPCKIERRRDGNTIWVSVSSWKKGAGGGTAYKDFPIYVSTDDIDPYIAYRLIEPGYESWHDMGIYQRELASYKESAIVTNKVNDRGCVNCHTFPSGDPERMLFHARGKGGGTVFIDGDGVRIMNLAEHGPKRQGTYPAWNPDGRHIVFSSNSTHQSFYASARQPLEVFDTESDIILMDLETDEISVPVQTAESLETFPAWSPDGRTLYFCSSPDPGNLPYDRDKLRYRLMAMDFDGSKFVGEPRCVLDIDSLSISFPRISGNKLVFTASAYGTFPIWHDEADLWIMNLDGGSVRPIDEVNSTEAESYHSWSSNGRWMIFSSRRIDGRYTRLYITHFNEDGSFTKPFLLPQKSNRDNELRLKSYNIPEFIRGKVDVSQKDIEQLFR